MISNYNKQLCIYKIQNLIKECLGFYNKFCPIKIHKTIQILIVNLNHIKQTKETFIAHIWEKNIEVKSVI